ncbi:helix-turn-helix domain-containing protein [Methylobacillus pratensis]
MMENYNHSYICVNNHGYLTWHNLGYIVGAMKFNERLVASRKYAGLTQQQLVDRLPKKDDDKPLMSQANLAKMEKNPETQGSMYTALIADICGVNAVWLTTGEGEMLPSNAYARTTEQARVLLAMENMPKPQQEAMVKISDSLIEQASDTIGSTATKQ